MQPQRAQRKIQGEDNDSFHFPLCVLCVLCGCIFLIEPFVASAARPSDIVEKNFVVKGDTAVAAAKLLGLSVDRENSYSLPWEQRDFARDCSYGIPGNEKQPGIQRCENLKAPVNTIAFFPGNVPELRLNGTWFDASTGTGPKLANYYFLSPNFLEKGGESGDWARVREALGKIPESQLKRAGHSMRAATDETKLPYLELSFFEVAGTGNLRLELSVNDEPPAAREAKEKAHEKCLREHADLDGGPC